MALKFVVSRRLILNRKLLEISSNFLHPGNFVNNNAILTAGGQPRTAIWHCAKTRLINTNIVLAEKTLA